MNMNTTWIQHKQSISSKLEPAQPNPVLTKPAFHYKKKKKKKKKTKSNPKQEVEASTDRNINTWSFSVHFSSVSEKGSNTSSFLHADCLDLDFFVGLCFKKNRKGKFRSRVFDEFFAKKYLRNHK